jgi:cytochrome c oxidase cbb3-type subunit 4
MSDDTLNLLRAVTTVLAFAAFLGVVAWAWSRRRRDEFEQAANLPLEEDDVARPVTKGHTTSSRGASDREAT